MKKSDLRRIIREEIEKVLSEAPQPQIAEPETDVETDQNELQESLKRIKTLIFF